MHVVLRFVHDRIGAIHKRHGKEEEELSPESEPLVLFNDTNDFLLTISAGRMRYQILRHDAGNHGKREGGNGPRPRQPITHLPENCYVSLEIRRLTRGDNQEKIPDSV